MIANVKLSAVQLKPFLFAGSRTSTVARRLESGDEAFFPHAPRIDVGDPLQTF